jgi:poly-gamma-glutamate capsule biosynthesis protein CapA/YwtB (metallophosphatase superfamily)
MALPQRRRQYPWRVAFAFAATAFAGSLVALAIVVARAVGDGNDPVAEGAPSVVTTPLTGTRFSYVGPLPAALATSGLVAAAPGKQADISFEPATGSDQVLVGYVVPVAAIGAGVDALTRAQLTDLATGRVTNWAAVGGVAGKVAYVAAGPAADQALVASFLPGAVPVKTFATYDALLGAMTVGSGMLALIPLTEVRVSLGAIALDGIDLVRGRGDTAAWPFLETVSVRALSKDGQAALATLRAALTVTPPKVTHVVATGDILMSRCSLAKIEASGDWAAALRGPMADYLSAADLALGSLDGSIQDIGAPYLCVAQDYPNLTSPPQVMAALTLAGFDEMTVATNHVFDCGRIACGNRAFLQTLDNLHQAGIKTVGGGNNLEDALAPAIFDVKGVKFGVLGFDDIAAEDLQATTSDPGTAPMDDSYADEKAALPAEPAFYKPAEMLDVTRLQDRIRALKQRVDVVIVQLQSGFEDTHDASPRSIKAVRAAIDAGADLVVGNQGHNVQSVEVRGNSFGAYALGNFIFDQQHTVAETEGYLLEASFWGKQLANVRMLPYRIVDQYRPTFVSGDERAKILGDIFTASAGLP